MPNSNRFLKDYIERFDNKVGLVNVENATMHIFNSYSKIEKIQILEKTFGYSRNISESQKPLFIKFIHFYFKDKELMPEKFLINFYLFEQFNDNEINYHYLIQDHHLCGEIKFDAWIKKYFLEPKKSGISYLSVALFKLIVFKYRISIENLIELLKAFLKNNKIIKIPKKHYRNKTKQFYRLVFGDEINLTEKEFLIEKINTFNFHPSLRIKASREELVRYFHAFFKYRYSNRRFSDILYDFSYGFFPIRNRDWIKNKKKYLKAFLKNEEFFESLINDVKKWTPLEFTLQKRIEYFNQFDINLSDSQKEIIKRLIEIDNLSFNITNFLQDLNSASTIEIFNYVTKKVSNHNEKRLVFENNHDLYEVNSTNIDSNYSIPFKALCYDKKINIELKSDEKNSIFKNSKRFFVNIDDNMNSLKIGDRFSLPEEQINFDYKSNINYECLLEPEVISNSLNDDLNILIPAQQLRSHNSDQDIEYYYELLFKKFRYRSFNSIKARCSSFSFNNRPNANDWNNYFKIWLSKKFISQMNFLKVANIYRFNIIINEKIITFENLIEKVNNFETNCIFSLTELRKKITSSNRPFSSTLNSYFIDLKADGTLKNWGIFYDENTKKLKSKLKCY